MSWNVAFGTVIEMPDNVRHPNLQGKPIYDTDHSVYSVRLVHLLEPYP